MKAHPAADLLPSMTDEEYAALKADISANGLRQPIITVDRQVLDGRHRLRACTELEMAPVFEAFTGPDPVAYVLSSNLHRRHLTASQRAAVAVEAEAMYAAAAAKRKSQAKGKPRGSKSLPADLPEQRGEALDHAAKATGASRRTAQNAKAVKAADPELFDKVKAGDVSVDAAAKTVRERQAYEKAVTEFPFLGPDESPGVPPAEVVDLAAGLRATPEGPERDLRIDAAKRWHRVHQGDGAKDPSLVEYRTGARAVEAVLTMRVALERLGDTAAITGALPHLALNERREWQEALADAAGVLTEMAGLFQSTPRMRRAK